MNPILRRHCDYSTAQSYQSGSISCVTRIRVAFDQRFLFWPSVGLASPMEGHKTSAHRVVFALSFHHLVKICLTTNQCNLSFIVIKVSIQLRARVASLQIHVIQGFFPIQVCLVQYSITLFLAAFHGLKTMKEISTNAQNPKRGRCRHQNKWEK